ncbi:hypothetical protein PAMP_002245 [Pampus punctatissimus]
MDYEQLVFTPSGTLSCSRQVGRSHTADDLQGQVETGPQPSGYCAAFFTAMVQVKHSLPSFFTAPLMGSPLLFPAVCASCLETVAAVQLAGIFFLFTGVTGGVGGLRGQHMDSDRIRPLYVTGPLRGHSRGTALLFALRPLMHSNVFMVNN